MKSLLGFFILGVAAVADPIGDTVAYRIFQSVGMVTLVTLVWWIATMVGSFKRDLTDGHELFRKHDHRLNNHSKRLFAIDKTQEEPFDYE